MRWVVFGGFGRHLGPSEAKTTASSQRETVFLALGVAMSGCFFEAFCSTEMSVR